MRSDQRKHAHAKRRRCLAIGWPDDAGDRFWETLADPCSNGRDGVCLTAWTWIRPPVYSAT